jgi:hypothetical protein
MLSPSYTNKNTLQAYGCNQPNFFGVVTATKASFGNI